MLHKVIFLDPMTELPGLVDLLRRRAQHRMENSG